MEFSEQRIRWILITLGAIMFLMGFIIITPRPEATTEIDLTYTGIGLILLGVFFLFRYLSL